MRPVEQFIELSGERLICRIGEECQEGVEVTQRLHSTRSQRQEELKHRGVLGRSEPRQSRHGLQIRDAARYYGRRRLLRLDCTRGGLEHHFHRKRDVLAQHRHVVNDAAERPAHICVFPSLAVFHSPVPHDRRRGQLGCGAPGHRAASMEAPLVHGDRRPSGGAAAQGQECNGRLARPCRRRVTATFFGGELPPEAGDAQAAP